VGACADCFEDEPVREAAHVIFSTFNQGQQLSRQDADVLCLDDAFPTLIAAVLRGRRFRSNINAYVEFRVTFSIVLAFLSLLGAAGGMYILRPVQMLWLKVVVDIVAVMALAPVKSSWTPNAPRVSNADLSSIEPVFDSSSSSLVTAHMAVRIFVQAVLQSCMMTAIILHGRYWVTDCTALDAHDKCFAILANGLSAKNGWREGDQHYLYSLVFNALMLCQIGHLVGVRLLATNSSHV
jgi:magnesium-transporting ATPase (P-type)